jgi:hypothetical protein
MNKILSYLIDLSNDIHERKYLKPDEIKNLLTIMYYEFSLDEPNQEIRNIILSILKYYIQLEKEYDISKMLHQRDRLRYFTSSKLAHLIDKLEY